MFALFPFPAQPEAGARLDAGRNLDLDDFGNLFPAGAPAVLAGVGDGLSQSATIRAGGADTEEAAGLGDLTTAATPRTYLRCGSRRRSGPAAFMTSLKFVDIDVPGEAKGGFHERDLHVIAQIGPRPGRASRPGSPVAESEDVAEDIAKTRKNIVETGKALETRTAQSLVAILIVDFPFLLVAEDFIGLGGFLEFVLRFPVPRISVRVVLHRHAAVTFLDFLFGGRAGYL